MKKHILLIDDDKGIRFTFKAILSDEGYIVSTAASYDEAREKLCEKKFNLIITDIILGGKTGIDLLCFIKEKKIDSPVVVITGYPTIDTASEAVRLGAFDYLMKPVDKKTLLNITKIALDFKAITDENKRYRSNLMAIFRSIDDGIITVDKELNIIELNDAGKTMCGFLNLPHDTSFYSIHKGCNNPQCLEALKMCIREKQPVNLYRHEAEIENKRRQILTMSINPLIGDKDEFLGAVMVVKDETYLVELENNFKERQRFHNIIGKSEKIQKIYSMIEKLANFPVTVLITGETGTGKELVAEALHYKGVRKDKPFVKINCSALPENILESELFGHVKGAFTGAIKDKKGLFHIADGGTIFLDEIGDISPSLQLRLLRVLQEGEFLRVGDAMPVKVDVRVIAATNQNIQEKIKEKEFREDLYYRLNVVELNLPPLRDRQEDIPVLANYFLEKLNKKFNLNMKSYSKEVLKIFMDYSWPGNIRELEHTVEHSMILSNGSIITTDKLPSKFKGYFYLNSQIKDMDTADEGEIIRESLEKTGWNKAKAARLLRIDRSTLYNKIQKYNISVPGTKTH